MHDSLHTIIAFDYGTRSIGVAVGQMITKTANPLPAVKVRQGNIDWQTISQLLQTWQPDLLIVGLPLNQEGEEQWITGQAKAFAKSLAQTFSKTVIEVDERYSTVAARSHIFDQHGFRGLSKDAVDSMSAKIILESWLWEH